METNDGWITQLVFMLILLSMFALNRINAAHPPHERDGSRTHRERSAAALPPSAGVVDDPQATLSVMAIQMENAYRARRCHELRMTWHLYLGAAQKLGPNAEVEQGYRNRRAQAITACPELVTELPELP
jgi:hypothetical protein